MSTHDAFWARRLRWRLIGAWRWPLFFVVTVLDALIVVWQPPFGAAAFFWPALILCSFGNLFLIGAVAPWLARRIAARQGLPAAGPPTFPAADHRELLADRIASAALVIGAVGLLVAGLGNQREPVCVTPRVCRAGDAVVAFVNTHAPPDVRRNASAGNLNAHQTQEDGFFRICVPYTDPRKQFCMFVDANARPPSVVYDHDSRPNAVYFHTPQ